jgi:hypothetical protein
MAIAKHNTEHQHCSVAPKTIPDDYKTLTVSDREKDVQLQVACTEGSPWSVEYYRQRLGQDQEMRYGDSNLSPSYQTYTRIQGLVLRVLEGIDPSIDDGINQSTGAAIIYAFTPNVGDQFIAKVFGGSHYIFDVTSVTPLTFLSTTAYRIEYMIHCTAEGSVALQSLTDKTFDTIVYDEKGSGCGTLLKPKVAEGINTLRALQTKLMDEYFRLFLDADTDLIILEDEFKKLYDDRLNRIIYHTWPLLDAKLGHRIRGLADIESEDNWLTLWDALLTHETLLFNYESTIPVVVADHYLYRYSQHNLMSHRIDYFMSADSAFINQESVVSLYGPAVNHNPPTLEYEGVMTPVYPLVADTYVLSEAWYNGVDDTLLEKLTTLFKNKEPLDVGLVVNIVKGWKDWPTLNKYFQTPLLMLFINAILDSPETPVTGGNVDCNSLT